MLIGVKTEQKRRKEVSKTFFDNSARREVHFARRAEWEFCSKKATESYARTARKQNEGPRGAQKQARGARSFWQASFASIFVANLSHWMRLEGLDCSENKSTKP